MFTLSPLMPIGLSGSAPLSGQATTLFMQLKAVFNELSQTASGIGQGSLSDSVSIAWQLKSDLENKVAPLLQNPAIAELQGYNSGDGRSLDFQALRKQISADLYTGLSASASNPKVNPNGPNNSGRVAALNDLKNQISKVSRYLNNAYAQQAPTASSALDSALNQVASWWNSGAQPATTFYSPPPEGAQAASQPIPVSSQGTTNMPYTPDQIASMRQIGYIFQSINGIDGFRIKNSDGTVDWKFLGTAQDLKFDPNGHALSVPAQAQTDADVVAVVQEKKSAQPSVLSIDPTLRPPGYLTPAQIAASDSYAKAVQDGRIRYVYDAQTGQVKNYLQPPVFDNTPQSGASEIQGPQASFSTSSTGAMSLSPDEQAALDVAMSNENYNINQPQQQPLPQSVQSRWTTTIEEQSALNAMNNTVQEIADRNAAIARYDAQQPPPIQNDMSIGLSPSAQNAIDTDGMPWGQWSQQAARQGWSQAQIDQAAAQQLQQMQMQQMGIQQNQAAQQALQNQAAALRQRQIIENQNAANKIFSQSLPPATIIESVTPPPTAPVLPFAGTAPVQPTSKYISIETRFDGSKWGLTSNGRSYELDKYGNETGKFNLSKSETPKNTTQYSTRTQSIPSTQDFVLVHRQPQESSVSTQSIPTKGWVSVEAVEFTYYSEGNKIMNFGFDSNGVGHQVDANGNVIVNRRGKEAGFLIKEDGKVYCMQ